MFRQNKSLAIGLTGERHNDHFEVRLSGSRVELTCSTLMALVGLIVARAAGGSGFLQINRVTIRRLRQLIDKAMRPGTGFQLIETGCREEYRLAIPSENLALHVSVEDTFFELQGLGIISPVQADALRRFCATQKKLEGNQTVIDPRRNLISLSR